jgi:hypothetical protein
LLKLKFSCSQKSTVSAGGSDRSALKNYQHVFIIMMENTGYNALIGNPNAPFINFAASTYGLVITPVSRIPVSRTTLQQRLAL